MNDLKTHYLRLYKAADEIHQKPDNPCHIRTDSDGKVTCANAPLLTGLLGTCQSLCCFNCPHLGPKGCTVRALYCKLHWCFTWEDRIHKMADHPTFDAILKLKEEAQALGVPLIHRASFEETFPDTAASTVMDAPLPEGQKATSPTNHE